MSDATAHLRGSLLLQIARRTLERRLWREDDRPDPAPLPPSPEPWLLDRAASFVSLHNERRLRGCVGSLEPVRPLIEDVRRNAVLAALEDRRFPPVAAAELVDLTIEVTLLAPRERIVCRTEEDAIARLRPGIDGLILTHGDRRATFLPQVWESIVEPGPFLAALKEKAGLEAAFWDSALVLERYTARRWSEDGPPSATLM